jgi:hypothetical protein
MHGDEPGWLTTLGIAYTGSALVALQSYAAVLPLWSRLETPAGEAIPTIQDFAENLGIFLAAYASEITNPHRQARCECVLVGYGDRADAASGWLIRADPYESGTQARVRELFTTSPDAIEILGSGSVEARRRLSEMDADLSRLRREPLEMIRRWLGDDPQDDVGGGVQIGLVTRDGFELFADAQMFRAGFGRVGQPLSVMTYRGFDDGVVGRVGCAFSTIRGLS